MLLYLSTTGESLARSFRRAYSRMCVRRSRGEKSVALKSGGGAGKAAKPGKAGKASGKAAKQAGKKGQGGPVISSGSGKAPAATSSMKAHHNALGLVLGATDELTLKADRAMIVVDCGGDGVGLAGGAAASSSEPVPMPPALGSVKVPVLLCLVVLALYVTGGAFLFHYLEGWTLMEGSYFCFTTLGTIGFGDLIPGRGAASGRGVAGRGTRAEVISVVAASAYIMVGMALVAMTFALVQDEFVSLLRRLSRQCTTAQVQTQTTPRPRPSCSDSESNTEPAGTLCGPPSCPAACPAPAAPGAPGAPAAPLPPRMAHSLPRRKASAPLADEFGRNGPGRRSAGLGGGRLSPEPLMEYFVPRSVSEFNLAGVVAEEDEVPEPPAPPKIPMPPGPPGLHPPAHHTILRAPGGGPSGARKLGMASSRSREKMVTFEDDAPGPCPGPPRGDVFM
ncbi:hypothetical protein ONE63_010521 [Megalurothrips usitatus]|uniref:Potassium channel domain-containing protein n=1 Tax=Megalurothrips usitatus TaxID=439358 RepID=A0AAV7XHT0_9NEOP|nr:hypothetical protein ONE63_010521 [Megalurothrips usitatus]